MVRLGGGGRRGRAELLGPRGKPFVRKGGLERDLDRSKKDLDAARRSVASLEDEKKGLVAAAERERQAADNRFAGIQLTGRRVVFLVDMSGSMEYVDEKTVAPEKWSGVRETLSKIMRSLPELEKFQVILFSDTVTYLFDGEEGWITHDARSAGRVTEALGKRRGEMLEITYDKKGGVRLEYLIPTRGLIGFRNTFLTLTAGTGSSQTGCQMPLVEVYMMPCGWSVCLPRGSPASSVGS